MNERIKQKWFMSIGLSFGLLISVSAQAISVSDHANQSIGIGGGLCEYATVTSAIAAASPDDTIYLSQGTYFEHHILVNKSLTFVPADVQCQTEILGASPEDLQIDASNNASPYGGVFIIGANQTVTFKNMTLTNAHANDGGIIYAEANSNLTLDNTVVKNGHAQNLGGGIYTKGLVSLKNQSAISNNDAMLGGGVYINGTGGIKLDSDAHITKNSAQTGAGVFVSASGPVIQIQGGTIDQNTAAVSGGGVYISADSSTSNVGLASTHIRLNKAVSGAGIGYHSNTFGGTLYIDSTRIENNEATADGGGIHISGSQPLTLFQSIRSDLIGNMASGNGGGLYLNNGANWVAQATEFVENTASGHGGGAYLTNTATLTGESAIFSSNSAFRGGGLYLDSTDTTFPNVILQSGSIIQDNTAAYGAGVYLAGSIGQAARFNMLDGVFSGNTASALSGAIYSQLSQVAIERSLFFDNSAIGASVLNNLASNTTFKNSIFHTNSGSELFQVGTDAVISVLESTFVTEIPTDVFSTSSNTAQVIVKNTTLSGFNDTFSGSAVLTSSYNLDSSGELGADFVAVEDIQFNDDFE